MQKVIVESSKSLADYHLEPSLTSVIIDLEELIRERARLLEGKTIWMINSTSQGGGVAEMLPSQMNVLRSCGVSVEWLVIETKEAEFFNFTKKIHNAIHGKGNSGDFNDGQKAVYDDVNRKNAEESLKFIKDGDIVVIHDPQPAGMASIIKENRDVKLLWRCHIGLELRNEATESAWNFLREYLIPFDHFVFSVDEYVPSYIDRSKVSIIPPAIDPLSYKNRDLGIHKAVGILHQAGVVDHVKEMVYPFYNGKVLRIQPDGSAGNAIMPYDLEILYRPVITQVSRWDHLKGFIPLIQAFVKLKIHASSLKKDDYAAKWINTSRLILAGPDLGSVSDDPEGLEVLNTIIREYIELPEEIQRDIAILLLPMNSAKENALIVNSLQRSSNIIVQNSIQEGFGLTATEAMWKSIPIVVSSATGLMQQVTDGVEGRVNPDASDPEKLKDILFEIIQNPDLRDEMGRNGKHRVVRQFNVLQQLILWVNCWTDLH